MKKDGSSLNSPIGETRMGQFTFLFTDIEGSTPLWERFPDAMRDALVRHDVILREAATDLEGHVFRTIGDAFCVAFAAPQQAILAAVVMQKQLAEENWAPLQAIRIRIGIYSGEASSRDNDYFGPCLNRVARLRDAAHGGQTIIADVDPKAFVELLPEVYFESKGNHKFKGIPDTLHVFQINIAGHPNDFPSIRSLSTHPSNLPAPVTSFVGREMETRDLSVLLAQPDVRLVTIFGFGGIGKTRLALEIGRTTLERYAQGVWFVDLSPLSDPALVLPAIVHTCRIHEDPHATALDSVIQHFCEAQALLILDNFERVEDASEEVASLLRFCPRLQIVVTSRTVVNLSAAHEVELSSLRLQESLKLFEVRARQVRPSFALEAENRALLEKLCNLCEGVPLVVELAAAQLRSQTLHVIHQSLQERIVALASKMRDLPLRHRTLRAAIDWSYELLSDEEQRFFRNLSVFVGGFATGAIAAVCGAEGAAPSMNFVGLLTDLRGKSLLRPPDASDRLGMLESLRQYGYDRLVEANEETDAKRRHLDWFLQLAESSETKYRTSEQTYWLDLLENDLDNLRAALDWTMQKENSIPQGLRLASALGYFWEVRGYFSEANTRLEKLLTLSARNKSKERARNLSMAGRFAWYQGNFNLAQQQQEESLRLYEESQDWPGSALTISCLGDIAYARGDYTKALALQNEALTIRRATGNQAGVAESLTNLGNIYFNMGNDEEAQKYYEACSVIAQELGDHRLLAFTLNNLGMLAFNQQRYAEASHFREKGLELLRDIKEKQGSGLILVNLAGDVMAQGEGARARPLYLESLDILMDVGDYRVLAFALEGIALLASEQGNLQAEVKLCAAAHSLRKRLGAPLPPEDQADLDTRLMKAKAQLKEEQYYREWKSGAQLSLPEVIAYASEF